MPREILLLNFSKHPAPQGIEDALKELGAKDFVLRTLNKDFGNVVPEDIPRIFESWWESLPQDKKNMILAGSFVIIPPGFPLLLAPLLAFLHGVAGHFPAHIFAIKDGLGYKPHPIDLQKIRDAARLLR